jgi:hypothetical protein
MIVHYQRCVARRVVSVLCRFSSNSKMAAMPTAAAKSGAGGGLKRAAIIIVGDEILKGETQVFTTPAILANEKIPKHCHLNGELTGRIFLCTVFLPLFEKVILNEYVLIHSFTL